MGKWLTLGRQILTIKFKIMKTRITVFTVLLISIIGYICWIFYMSEPKYIDNPTKRADVEKYDIISIRPYGSLENNLDICMVLQIDSTSFKNNHYALTKELGYRNSFKDVLINTETPNFKIIGTGTFYHKINHFIGFNIMLITTILIAIIGVIILIVLIGLLNDLFDWNF